MGRGAKLETGGTRIGDRGFFFAPTVLSDVPESARIMNEEPFGPVALIMGVSRRDPLHKRIMRIAASAWNPADSVASPDLERAKRLF